MVGRLLEHGPAPYEHRPSNSISYFAKIQTQRGTRTLWGKDLYRAITSGETRPKVGEVVGARRASRHAIETKNYRPYDGMTPRTHWQVEKIQLFADRARQARVERDASLYNQRSMRARPELKSTFLSMRAAELLAEKRIADPENRARFLALVREAIDNSVRKNIPLPDLPMRTSEAPSRTRRTRDDEPTR